MILGSEPPPGVDILKSDGEAAYWSRSVPHLYYAARAGCPSVMPQQQSVALAETLRMDGVTDPSRVAIILLYIVLMQ